MSTAPPVDLNTTSAFEYLAGRGISADRITELPGGVSNTVLLVEVKQERMVLKQSLPQLRVQQQWLSDRSRIWREAAALEMLSPVLPEGAVPSVLFRDDKNYLYAMSAAAEGAESWKSALLRGQCDLSIAERIGQITASLFRAGWKSEAMRAEYGDLTIFDQLRLDPYYRTTAARHPDLARSLSSLADDYARHCSTLVHGDWSPKNFLVGPAPAMAIDFEAIHFGDPAFDTAFLLNHLLLKSFHLPSHANDLARLANTFWTVTLAEMPPIPDFERRTIQHLGALLLARIDGKSPAEYIREQALRERIRLVARRIVLDPPISVPEVFESCR